MFINWTYRICNIAYGIVGCEEAKMIVKQKHGFNREHLTGPD